jgi:hypothetical protein
MKVTREIQKESSIRFATPAKIFWNLFWAYVIVLALFGLASLFPASAANIWDVDIPDVTSNWDINSAAASVSAFLGLMFAFKAWANRTDQYQTRPKRESLLDLVKKDLQPAIDNLDHVISDQEPCDQTLEMWNCFYINKFIKEYATALRAIDCMGGEIKALEKQRILGLANAQQLQDSVDQYKSAVKDYTGMLNRVWTWTTATGLSENEKLDIIGNKIKAFEGIRGIFNKTATTQEIFDGITGAFKFQRKIIKLLGLPGDASTQVMFDKIQQLKDDAKKEKDDDLYSPPPSLPPWIPSWATEDWFKNHPTKPTSGNACRHVEELQDAVRLPAPANSSLPSWTALLQRVRELVGHVCPTTGPAASSTPSVPMPRMSDFPTFDGNAANLLEWTSRVQRLLPAHFPFYDKMGTDGLPLLVNFCVGLFTDKAAKWAANEEFKLPATANNAESTLKSFFGMVETAFRDANIVTAARNKLRDFHGYGLSFSAFRLEFETLCRDAEIAIHDRPASSLVAEYFRTALTPSNLRSLKTTPLPGTDDCHEPADLTLKEMYHILEPRWYTQHPRKEFTGKPGIKGKAATISVRAAPVEKLNSGAAFPHNVPKDCRGPLSQGGDADKAEALMTRLKEQRRCWFCRTTSCPGAPAEDDTNDECRTKMGRCNRFKNLAIRGAETSD